MILSQTIVSTMAFVKMTLNITTLTITTIGITTFVIASLSTMGLIPVLRK
jgi:hypothetical protein